MKSIKFIKNHYNGIITPYAISYELTELTIENDNLYIYIEREHYLSPSDGYKREVISGKALLEDIFYNINKEEYIEGLEGMKGYIESNYKEEYFKNEVPDSLAYSVIEIDGKEYKLSNRKIKDDEYTTMVDLVDGYCQLISLPSKLLKEVLKNKPFDK